jgi:hypothetical protein
MLYCCMSAEAKVDAGLASRATAGAVSSFSRAMALRRLHWKNSLLGELLYLVNVSKVSRWLKVNAIPQNASHRMELAGRWP